MSHTAYNPNKRHIATSEQLESLFEETRTALWLFGVFGGLQFAASSKGREGPESDFYGFRQRGAGWSRNLPLLPAPPRFSTKISLELVRKLIPCITDELDIRGDVRLTYAEAYFDYGRNRPIPPACRIAFQSAGNARTREGFGSYETAYTIDWDPPLRHEKMADGGNDAPVPEGTDNGITVREYVLLSEIISNWSEYAQSCTPVMGRPMWQLPEEE